MKIENFFVVYLRVENTSLIRLHSHYASTEFSLAQFCRDGRSGIMYTFIIITTTKGIPLCRVARFHSANQDTITVPVL